MSARTRRGTLDRIAVVRALLLAAFLGLAFRAAHLSVIDQRGFDLGRKQRYTRLVLAPERGAILDRNGQELALSIEAPSLYAVPSRIADPAEVARKIAPILGRTEAGLRERLDSRGAFVFLARWVSEEQAAALRALAIDGIDLVNEPRRIYPYRSLAAPVVGFANIDGLGVRGIEQQEDDWLQGTPRTLSVERDGSGRILLASGDDEWHTAGGDVMLTIDAPMQSDAQRALSAAIERTHARGGSIVTLDPSSGEILALAEAPGFDPNQFRTLDFAETRSRAFLDAAEPGSTLKTFLIAAALERGVIGSEDWFDCENGSFALPGKVIRDHHPYGRLQVADVLRVSSNIGSVKIGALLGPRAHVDMLRSFGFGSISGSGFPDESSGMLRDVPPNRPVDQATLAFGQGISVTPVQLAAATAALASGGRLFAPRLIGARRSRSGPWESTPPQALRRVVSEQTARRVMDMMEGVVSTTGTGRLAALRGLRVGGKTGTAQKFDEAAGVYSQDRYVSWFIGAVPADAPRLVIVASLDEPRRPLHTGGMSAAPLFAEVAAAQLARLGISTAPYGPGGPPPEPEIAIAAETSEPAPAAGTGRVEPAPAPLPRRETPPPQVAVAQLRGRVLLPDLENLSVTEVRAVLRSAGLALEVRGEGRAVAQDPPAGSIVSAEDVLVRVRFENPPAAPARADTARAADRDDADAGSPI